MTRYHLIEVGCLECGDNGDCEPEVIMSTDDLEEHRLMMEESKYSREVDRFVFDSDTGRIISLERGK